MSPLYPFRAVSSPGGEGERVLLEFNKPYSELYYAIAIAVPVVVLIFSLAVTENVTSTFFPYPLWVLVFSLIAAAHYSNVRVYTLDHASNSYTFSVGRLSVSSGMHNIYVRLCKSAGSGFFLVLDGCRVDRHVLTRPSENEVAMRNLGKLSPFCPTAVLRRWSQSRAAAIAASLLTRARRCSCRGARPQARPSRRTLRLISSMRKTSPRSTSCGTAPQSESTTPRCRRGSGDDPLH